MNYDTTVLFNLCHMLSATLGKMFQVTVSDRTHYLFVKHAFGSEIYVGAPIKDKEAAFLKSPDFSNFPFVANYKNLSKNMNRLRASTFFFKDENGEIMYMLTVTANVDEFVKVREIIDVFTNGITTIESPAIDTHESITKVEVSVNDVIDDVIAEGERRYSTDISHMTTFEKHSLIREMSSRGVFLIKGSVSDVAHKLEYSEATIYRYIKKLEAQENA